MSAAVMMELREQETPSTIICIPLLSAPMLNATLLAVS